MPTGNLPRPTYTGSEGLIGRVLLGRYRIVRELAKGGMGVVYLARSEGAGGFVKPVVVKLVLPQHAKDKRFVGLFVREAQILAELRHPSIVPVLEFGEENGAYVMVLDYIRGYHLGQWNKYVRKQGRLIPAPLLLPIMVDVLDALHKAHSMVHPDGTSMHIVHRDVSPSNIMLDEDGRARLLDFGVARMRGGSVDYETQTKSFVGKFTYSAPELFGGAEASASSDAYSCAVVLHEMLFGRNVFVGEDDASTLYLALHHTPEPIEALRPDAPRGLDAVLQKALAKSAEHRFASAGELAAALRALYPAQESELRAQLAAILREDFGEKMAKVLGVESLAQRDRAWRSLPEEPEPEERTMMIDIDGVEVEGESMAPGDASSENVDLDSHVRDRRTARPRAQTLQGLAAPVVPATPALPAPVPGVLPAPGRRTQTTLNSGVVPHSRSLPPPPPSAASAPMPLVGGKPAKGRAVQATWIMPRMPASMPSNRRWTLALIFVGCLALTAIVVSVLKRSSAPVPTPTVRVVGLPPPGPTPAELEAKARAEAQARLEAERRAALDVQQPRLDVCFKRHARRMQLPEAMELAFEVDPTGKPTQVALSPEKLNTTPLGRCLRNAAKGARFPAEELGATFSLPIAAP